ncbi:YegP family protein [Xanthobacter agilis]|uniref:YegP family protein n=1 Tax=Xanthobacter agilis TaxID=47492 RepID=UPI00372CC588
MDGVIIEWLCIFNDKAGELRFRYRTSNGEIMFSPEGYKAKASVLTASGSVHQEECLSRAGGGSVQRIARSRG